MKALNKRAAAIVVGTAALAICALLAPTTVSAQSSKVTIVDVGPAQPATAVNAKDGLEINVVKEEGDRWLLRVRNRTPFIVILYIHGHRIGWLRPFRTGRIRGLRRGFHRLYAHSRWGSTYWGPRSVWVPGTWSLYR